MSYSNDKAQSIPAHSQWLEGQGGGVWFAIDQTTDQNKYRIRRYSDKGDIDCDFIFEHNSDVIFNIKEAYEFTFISHCAEVRILQNGHSHFFRVFSTDLNSYQVINETPISKSKHPIFAHNQN